MIGSAYLAADGFQPQLETELTRLGVRIDAWHGLLALSPDAPRHAAWALDIWTAPVEIPAPSVKAAADALRAMQRNWSLLPLLHHRRAALITERLPPVKAKPLVFPEPAPTSHLGAWTLLATDRLLASPTKSSPFVNGEVVFEEDHIGPPSRAYLKLWEAITRFGVYPKPGDVCIDLGATPGGWSWVLASLGAQVTAVDKAPLAPKIAAMPNVTYRQESAFGIVPAQEPTMDWLVCDVIAYPSRMVRLMQAWVDAGKARNIVCTLKFQGETDFDSADAFAAIPGGRVVHLSHNKHELTFLWSENTAQFTA